jgi:hypothetical protein
VRNRPEYRAIEDVVARRRSDPWEVSDVSPRTSKHDPADDRAPADQRDEARAAPPIAAIGALQRSAGNAAVARYLSRRPDPTAPAPAAHTFGDVLGDRLDALRDAYQSVFERQAMAIDELARDLAKADEPSLTDQVVRWAIETALTAACGAVGGRLAAAVGNVAGEVITKRAVASARGLELPGLTLEELVAGDVDAAKARASAVAGSFGKWAGDRLKAKVPTVLDKISTELPGHEKFIQGQRNALADAKDAATDQVHDEVAPALRDAEPQQALMAVEALVEAARAARSEAQPIQFLHSVAEWAKLIHGEGMADPTVNFTGVLRIRIGEDAKHRRPAIEEARFTDMDKDVLKRLMSTKALSGRRLYDLPCQKVVHGPCFIFKRAGQPVDANSVRSRPEWVFEWARIHHGMERHNPVTDTMVAAALLFHEIDQLTIGDLGTIKHDDGGGLFDD